jgi:hypothetical protein
MAVAKLGCTSHTGSRVCQARLAPLKDIEEAKKAAIDDDLERFMEFAVGIRSNSSNWLKSSSR